MQDFLGMSEYQEREFRSWFGARAKEVTGLREASKLIFGVSSLGFLVPSYSLHDCNRIKEFFADNHSDLIEWANVAKNEPVNKYNLRFNAMPMHRAIYKDMKKKLGLEVAVYLTMDRDFADTCIGYVRYKEVLPAFLERLKGFPKTTWAKAVHDYLNKRLEKDEEKGKYSAPLPFEKLAALPETLGEYKVLVPKKVTDLKAIGNAQGHCVGTKAMGYEQKVRNGEVYIFALYTKQLADGICVEVDAKTGHVLQVQGKGRREPKEAEMDSIGLALTQLGFSKFFFMGGHQVVHSDGMEFSSEGFNTYIDDPIEFSGQGFNYEITQDGELR